MKAIVKIIPHSEYVWSRDMAIVLIPENENDETLISEVVDQDSKFSCTIHSEDTFAAEVSKRKVKANILKQQKKTKEVQNGNSERETAL